MKKLVLMVTALLCLTASEARQYWKINKGENSITWQVGKEDRHTDHIEMSGKKVSVVLRYGTNSDGEFKINKSMVWPMLRTIPNNTHASLMRRYDWNPLDMVTVNGRPMSEKVRNITLDGTLTVVSDINRGDRSQLELKRTYFPSTELPALFEIYEFTNTGKNNVRIEIPEGKNISNTEKGVYGIYNIHLDMPQGKTVILKPGEKTCFQASISSYRTDETVTAANADALKEQEKRQALIDGWMENLVLETPDETINEMFSFSKIRALESIYETKDGPMHGPGGESYYAAIWANDQAEYINAYFPFTGYGYGNASAMNSFRQFAEYMNDEWKPIPSSIIAEGDSYWNGAGDRGDAAMIAYGAARFALANGNRKEAEKLWELIEWCLEFNRRKLNEGGVVASDSDELEGRFPAGDANLCTSSLYYDALLSAAYLAEELGKGSQTAKTYRKQAAELRKAMDKYFPAEVEGYDTYAYYKGNDVLRAWICIPLTVGINERAEGTIEALFSPRLWTENGLLTQAGTKTFWDRSTLYALRGVFMAGETEKALKFMKHYSNTRLLGEHVPYAVEAWPEGGQRHLSTESALYGRIVTEGIFGIRPTGFDTFTLTPRLPKEWDEMALRHIRAFGEDFDIEISRTGKEKLQVTVKSKGKVLTSRKIKEGATLKCKL